MIISGGMSINVFENLKALNVDCDIVTNDNRPVKTRYVDEISNQMLLRVDEKDAIKRIGEKRLASIDFSKYDAVVISDYNKGFLIEKDIKYIAQSHNLTFMDTKKTLDDLWCGKIKYIKINEKEFELNRKYLLNDYENDLIVTRGKNGALLNNKDCYLIDDVDAVIDLSGAGDTFLAGLVADFINNYDICSAIKFANKCASWAVAQKGVSIVDKNKIE